jgi:pyrroloquinoline quinone biosynthesis protein B
VLSPDAEDNVALRIRESQTGRTLVYASATGAVTPAVRAALQGAHCVLFDGTFWSSDELPAQGLGSSRAEDMAHVPIGGPQGSLALLGAVPGTRRIYIHINNTNPILREDSPERQAVSQQGWEVAYDGMEVVL